MEEQVYLKAGEVSLEARFSLGSAAAGVVITHPHPLYGGSMDNNVVWTAARAFGDRGWSTLRVNFRGVGQSTGVYGDGVAEVEDVAGAAAYLASRVSGPCFLAGYSFGAAVVARALIPASRPPARCSSPRPWPLWIWLSSPRPPALTSWWPATRMTSAPWRTSRASAAVFSPRWT